MAGKTKYSGEDGKITTIAIPMKLKENLQAYGTKGESYSDILARLLQSARERMLRDCLMDTTNCVTIEEARKELEKKWPRSK